MNQEIDRDNLPDLSQASVSTEELSRPFDYTRPLAEYGGIEAIVNHLQDHFTTQHIYTKHLQAGGRAVADEMVSYLAHPGYSSGQLKAALRSPLHLYYERESGWKEDLRKFQKKTYFELGTFLHECLLEPTKFRRTIVEPKHSLSTTDGVEALIKFWKDVIIDTDTEGAFIKIEAAEESVRESGASLKKLPGKKKLIQALKSASGITAVKEEHKLIIDIVRYNYMSYGSGILPRLIKHSKREISCYGTDPVTGLAVKCRPDAIQFEENIGVNAIISVKSTSQEDIAGYIRHSARLKYELSEGFYQDVVSRVTGRDFNTTITIMLQTAPPFGVAALVWRGEDIEAGKYKARTALDIAHQCLHEGYPGYDVFSESGNFGLIENVMPDWIQRELMPSDVRE